MAAEGAAFAVARSFSGRRWRLAARDEEAVRALARTGLSDTLAGLLAARGIAAAQAADFLSPTLKKMLPEPFALADMERAVARAVAAIEAGEKIAVFGDYDVDGSCASALLCEFLARVAARPRLYIPDRMTEGYGPSPAAMRRLKEEGASLLFTVDCGAAAGVALAAARDLGLDVIVLDHHAVHDLPPAFAHVNPNRAGDASGLTQVCAAGIVFLFLVALNRALREAGRYASGGEPDLRYGLDLVALATVCDVVPLLGVNRAFVRAGLAVLGAQGRPGLAALAEVAAARAPFTPHHLGYVLGPRINAGGRVGRSSLGVDLLTAADAAAAGEFATLLDLHNRERQALEKTILAEAEARAAAQANTPFLLLGGEGWHAGVVGIVAARLRERFARPAFVAGFEGGLGRGSARSVPGIDIGAMVRAAHAAGLIESGGGHAMAAGFSLFPEQLEPFGAFLAERFAGTDAALDAAAEMVLETLVSAAGATPELVAEMAQAGPFGAGNPEPLVGAPDLRVAFADVVGRDHVRLQLQGGDGARLSAIAFRAAGTPLGQGLLAARGKAIHAAGRLRAEEWNGRVRVQLHLEDAAPAGA